MFEMACVIGCTGDINSNPENYIGKFFYKKIIIKPNDLSINLKEIDPYIQDHGFRGIGQVYIYPHFIHWAVMCALAGAEKEHIIERKKQIWFFRTRRFLHDKLDIFFLAPIVGFIHLKNFVLEITKSARTY